MNRTESMARGLQRRLTRHGDARFSRFLRDAHLKAQGLTDDALGRPVVGIASTESDFNPCHAGAPLIVDAIKRGVMLAGGLPLSFPTTSPHESFSSPTSMLFRNLMAMDTEEMLHTLPIDAVVLIGGCDKTVPAQLMAALSANVPALSIVVGPMLTGNSEGERLGACTDCRRLWSSYRAGEIDDGRIGNVQAELMPTFGTCMVMGTASTMACIAEALGFMLPGGATIPAVVSERLRHAEETGRQAVRMAIAGGPAPRELVTARSLRNAAVVLQALGGSTNAVIHLAAIAGRAGLRFDLEALDAIGRETPVLVDLKPVGRFYMQDFHVAGALPAMLRHLRDRLDLSAAAAGGRSWGEVIDSWPAWIDANVIRTLDDPVAPNEGLVFLKGSLAPDGAILKKAAASPHLLGHEGPAVVFNDIEDLAERIDSPDLPVTPDHVLVLRNAGPVGAPGMPEAGFLPIPKKILQTGTKDMVRISDARMSGTAFGTVVLHATPEAAIGGPLALVETNDIIRLDAAERRIDLLVGEEELQRRRAGWTAPAVPARGYRRLYVEHVLQAGEGCDFDFLAGFDNATE